MPVIQEGAGHAFVPPPKAAPVNPRRRSSRTAPISGRKAVEPAAKRRRTAGERGRRGHGPGERRAGGCCRTRKAVDYDDRITTGDAAGWLAAGVTHPTRSTRPRF